MKAILFAAVLAAPIAVAAEARAENIVIGSYHAGLCMEMRGSAVTAPCGSSSAQVFQFSGYGALTQGGKCLAGQGEGQPLALQSCNNGRDQKWGFNGKQLNNEAGWCADIEREARNAGARVLAYKCKGSSNQQWRLGGVQSGGQLPQSAAAGAKSARQGDVIDVRSGKVVAMGGANVVAMGGANVVAMGGANVVAMGGANFIQFK